MHAREQQLGKYFMGGDKEAYVKKNQLLVPANPLEAEFEQARLEKDAKEAREMYLELEKKKQADLEAKLQTLELVPMLNKVILLPYPRNPYRKVMHGNIIVEYTGEFDNPDSGTKDQLKELVGCAQVMEVGPEVKYLKEGDDVFYDTRTCYPVPFLSLGYIMTSEPQILCVLNENLKERFKMTQV